MKRRVVLLIIAIIMIFNFTSCANSDKSENDEVSLKQYYKYLDKNNVQIDLEDNEDYSSLKLLKDDLKNNELFLIGEVHDIKDNAKVFIKFLKYLKQETNFKYLVEEDEYLYSIYKNKYLQTGDENYLNKFVNKKRRPEKYEMWKEIYRYNKTLKDEDKIQVVAIGIDGFGTESYLIDMLKDKKYEEVEEDLSILKELYEIMNLDENTPVEELKKQFDKYKNKLPVLTDKIYKNKNLYEDILKEEAFDFFMLIDNLKNTIEVWEGDSFDDDLAHMKREEKLYENFEKIYNHYPKGKYFGQFGLSHIYKEETTNRVWLAEDINEKIPELKDKILSIALFYKNSYSARAEDILSTYNDNEVLDKYLKSNHTLIKLNGKNSPFSKVLYTDFISEIVFAQNGYHKSGVTTDYFDYVMIIQDSK
ncbi:hypothetical protein [Clostridium sp. UBA6640]|uniref:hypothetical protein n=1 Tax=Clostridium sp. UBA6640 TaxID=1946370 RepID=UPI0025C6CF13|nr:hypothetical protein [Clostridium sp. UBA6640]